MAQFVADMYLDQLAPTERGGAEIGIVNPGGVRDNLLFEPTPPELEDGIVRVAEANAVLPFVNNLWSAAFTGAQLDRVLEEQWQRGEDGTPFTTGRTYLQLGLSDNVTYVSDPTRPIDDRVSDIAIDGRLIAPGEEIRVASASFLFGPCDNFWTMGEGADLRDSGLVDLDAMLAYLADSPGIGPDCSVRHVDVVGLPTEAAVAGSEVTVQVSLIDRIRSTGAAPSTLVEVLDTAGAVVGSGAVTAVSDASGKPLSTTAAVTLTADTQRNDGSTAAETYTLRATNGTLIPFQIDVTAEAPTAPGNGNGNGHAYGHTLGNGHTSHGNGNGRGHDNGAHSH